MSSDTVADIKFSKRFSANLITNIISLILSTLVGLLLIPYFIETLGEAAYGLVPLATSVTSYVTILVNSLNAATGRYLMFDLRAAKINDARITFNTALTTIICCVSILAPVAAILAFCSPFIFNIGDISSVAVIELFSLVFGSALLNMITANFTLCLYSYNRFDLKNTVTIVQTLMQITIILALFNFFAPSLPFIGIAYIIAACFALILAIILVHKYCPELKFGKEYVSKERFKTLFSMTMWTLIKFVGVMLRSNIGLVIANIVCGVIIGAEYAIIFMWQTLLVSIMSSMTIIFNPNVYSYCAKNDTVGLISFISLATRATAITAALIVGLLTIYSSELLTIWVGEEFAHLGFAASLLVFPIIFRAAADNLNYVMIAKLRFRQNSLVYLLAGILTLVCSAIGAYFFGIIGLIIAGGLVMILCEGGGIFLYTSHLLGKGILYMLKYLIPGVITLAITLAIGFFVKMIFSGTSIWTLIIGGVIIATLSIIICSRFLLSKKDKTEIRSCMPSWIDKKMPKWLF